jgi:hypothetical protein
MFMRKHETLSLSHFTGSPYALKPLVLAAALSIVATSVAQASTGPGTVDDDSGRAGAGASLGATEEDGDTVRLAGGKAGGVVQRR